MSLPSFFRHPHCSRERILAFQNRRLRRLVRHAYEHVPYYRRLFDAHGIHPRNIQTTADLHKIPFTTKDDLRACPVADTLTAGLNPEKMVAFSTSGFSGEPFTIRRTGTEQRLWRILWLRTMHYLGLRMNNRIATVAYIRNGQKYKASTPQRLLNAFGLYRHHPVDCRQHPSEIVRELRACAPGAIRGYPNVLTEVAHSMDASDRKALRPHFVMTFGETVTPAMHEVIREGFDAPVYDMYGCHELGMVAWSCRNSPTLHVCDDSVVVEVLKDGRTALPGERGELVGTNLHVLSMPFIRYKIGDVVVRADDACTCGQPFATLRSIEGRAIDYFPMPSGRLLHPYAIVVEALATARWMWRYQLVQESTDRIVMRIVPQREVTQEEIRTLESAVMPLLDAGVAFRVELVPEIRHMPGGKYRVSRSMVRSAYNDANAMVSS